MTESSQQLYDLKVKGQFQDALLFAEDEFYKDSENINRIVDYVSLLIDFKLFDKAVEVISDSPYKPQDNKNIYFLYVDLYTRWPRLNKLNKLNKKCLPGFSDEAQEIKDITSKETDLRPDKRYFKNQLLELLKELLDYYPEYQKIFKKVFVQIKNNRLEDGYYNLKEFALSTDKKNLGYFVLAELSLVDKKFKLAKERYKKLEGKFEPNWIIYNRLGDIELAQSNEKRAESYYLKAIALNPDDFDTNLDLIRTFALKGEIEKAKKQYNSAAKKFGEQKVKFILPLINKTSISKFKGTIINGLVWHEHGGNILSIELSISESKETEITPFGNLGITILDSIHLANKVARQSDYYKKHLSKKYISIQINIPESIIYKDGPSAGLAFVIGIMGEFMSKKIPSDAAFTGELTLEGRILPIGGLKEKLTAAYVSGIKTVYIPKDNFPDLVHLQNRIKSALKIRLVDHYENVIEDMWKN